VKVEMKEEYRSDVDVKQEEFSGDDQTVKREVLSEEEQPQASRVGDFVER
jgi:hypothetical protein